MPLNNPVLLGLYAAIIAAISSLVVAVISKLFDRKNEKEKWLRSELQNIYGSCIKSLTTPLTLAYIPTNLDTIEGAIIEAKKWLALVLIYHPSKKTKEFKELEQQVSLFITGQYDKFLEVCLAKGVQPSEKYRHQISVYQAADIMLGRILEFAYRDKRLF
jgi:hypothetical protein